jgi:hypothetical protein
MTDTYASVDIAVLTSAEKRTYYHRRNLTNNIGGVGGGNRPWLLGTLIYEGVKLERRESFV